MVGSCRVCAYVICVSYVEEEANVVVVGIGLFLAP